MKPGRSPKTSHPGPSLWGLLLLLTMLPHAAVPAYADGAEKAKKFVFRLADNQKKIWTAPVKRSTWTRTSTFVFVGFSASSFSLDGDFSSRLRGDDSLDDFNRFFASNTSDVVLSTLPVAIALTGLASRNDRVTRFGYRSIETALSAWIATAGVKGITQRSRPNRGETYGFWDGGSSFSSGHAAVAWSVAALACREFPNQRWLPWVAYPLAGAVSFSRVSSGNHFASDVVFGSFLGWSIGHHLPR